MPYGTASLVADLGAYQSVSNLVERIAASLHAAAERSEKRRDYRKLLRDERLLDDLGLTRKQVRQAIADC